MARGCRHLQNNRAASSKTKNPPTPTPTPIPVFAPSDKLPSSSEAVPGWVGVDEAETDGGREPLPPFRISIPKALIPMPVVVVVLLFPSVSMKEPGTWHGGRMIALAIPISIQILVCLGPGAVKVVVRRPMLDVDILQ